MAPTTVTPKATKASWAALVALATAQFVMVLDQSVMNVSISALVKDFNTTVTTIQAVITLYCLVMAMLIMTGAKIGDIIGRRKAFVIGLVIYACGSALTAAFADGVYSRSRLVGARRDRCGLVLPALAALIAGNFEGLSAQGRLRHHRRCRRRRNRHRPHPRWMGDHQCDLAHRVRRARSYWSRSFSIMTPKVGDTERPSPIPKLDYVGSLLSAGGLGLFVFAVLESSTWGWLKPKNSPLTIFGFS